MSDDLKAQNFMRSLCVGNIEEDIIFPYPKLAEHEVDIVKSVSQSLKSWLEPKREEFRKWDVAGKLPPEILQEMKEFGLFSLIIPEEHGGLGLSATAYSRVIQELALYEGSVTLTAAAHSSIGMKGLLLYGTEEQKKKYLPKLATGEMIAAYCLTEAGAGSDAASIKAQAVKEGDEWILSGEKIWITNGEIGNFFTVFAKTDTPEGKMSAFIVTRDMEGVSVGPHEDKMGMRASATNTVFFDKVRLKEEHVLGPLGKGFKIAMSILNHGRTGGLGGGSVGGMKKCIELCTKQAKERKQFGKSLSEYGLIKKKIGQMVVDCYAAETAVNMVSGLIDQGYEDYAVEAAISKVYATEALWRTLDEGLQIAGGNGFMREFPYERHMRDSRVFRIFEGANEILRLFIALTAVKDAGEQLKELAKTIGNIGGVIKDPIKGFGVLSNFALKQVKSKTPYGRATLSKAHPSLKHVSSNFETHVQQLTSLVDRILRKHGKNIIGKQFATSRLAEVIMDTFILGAMISRVTQSLEEKGAESAAKEVEILETFAFQAGKRIRYHIKQVDDNMDEKIKSLSDHAVEEERFCWDNL